MIYPMKCLLDVRSKGFMMKKLTYLMIIFTVLFFPFDAMAKIKGSLSTDKDVSRGGQLEVTISLDRNDKGEEIDIYKAIIDYDENLFSGIDKDSFETSNGWGSLQYSEDTHALILINKYGSSANEQVITFKLNLKDNASPSETKIKLRNQIVSNEVTDIFLDDTEANVDVNIHLMDLASTNKNNAVYAAPLVDSPVKIYHVLTLIVLELIIAIILTLIYKYTKDRIQKPIYKRSFIGALLIVEIFALSAIFTYSVSKGDLNGDKSVDEFDITILSKHLVNAEMMSQFKLENADMNGDGKITPADLSILVNKCTKKAAYQAKLTSAFMENNGYEKGATIDFRFLADVTNDEVIEYVILDGEKRKVEKVSDNEYAIKLSASNQSNKYSYNITEVVLKNGKTAKVDYGTDIVVLKDAPELIAFSTKEELSTSSVKAALTIKDDDGAIVTAKYELVNSKGEIVANGNLDRGKNALDLKLENAVSYKLKLKIDYNRGSDSGEYYGTIEDSYDLRIITDYKFKIWNISLNQNGTNTKSLEKSLKTKLVFNSSNVSGYSPKKININGKEYTVSNMGGGKYSVELPNSLLMGNNLNIKKVTLSNGKVIVTDEKVSYIVLKEKPTLIYFDSQESIEDATLHTAFQLRDEDSTINYVTARLYDENNLVISEKTIYDHNYDVDLTTALTSKYKVRIFADYTRAEGVEHRDELLFEKEIAAKIQAQINDYSPSEIFPEKNSIITLNYNITSNYKTNVKQIVINNVIYEASKTGIDSYKVEIAVGEEDGLKDFDTKKIIFDNGLEYDIERATKIDVLKEYPILENYGVIEDIKDQRIDITFDIFDTDGAFERGEIRFIDKELNEVIERKDVIIGKNKASFSLENAKKYEISIDVFGVRDTKTLDEESPNRFEDYNLYKNEYRIISDYKLEISSIETSRDGKVTDQFGADEPITVSFKSTNITEFEPIKISVNGVYYDLTHKDGIYSFELPSFNAAGSETLRFENIILSNHKELPVNVYKTIEILKAIPQLEEITLTKTSNDKRAVSIRIDDRDNTLFGLKAVVRDLMNNELYNGPIENDEFEFTKDIEGKYEIEIIASYDINNDTSVMEENRFVDKTIFKRDVDETIREFDMTKIAESILYEKKTEQKLETVSDDILNDLNKYAISLVMEDGSAKTYEIHSYLVNEQTVTFVLKTDKWVTTEDEKTTNLIKITFYLAEKKNKK